MKTLNILSFSLILILHISIDLRSQEIPDHRTENYIPQERNFSQFPLNLNSNTTNTWEQLHPTIPRVDYWGVYFIDTATGFAVGDGGALIKTIDGGLTWRTIESGVTSLLRTIGSYDGSVIVAAGDLGKIIISTDVGETWAELQSVVPHNLWNIQFVTEQIGWLVGLGSSALKTTDGGYTWINQQTPLNNYPYWDVSFYDTTFGYICTNLGSILRTTNGGVSWDVQQVYDNYGFFTIKAVTGQRAVALGFAGKHAVTTNGGNSWDFVGYWGSTYSAIEFIDTLSGFALGDIWSSKTTDGGQSWTTVGGMPGGTDFQFVNSETGYLVSGAMTIRKSTNAGTTWHSSVINDNFIDVFFTSNVNGWFIGRGAWDYTSLFQTTDGGQTLIWRNDFTGPRPSSVYFIDSLTGIIGAEDKIYKTINGGVTWEEKNITNLPSGDGGIYDRIFFITENTGWAKSNHYVVKTIDGGENWQFQFQAGSLRGIHFSDAMNGWLTWGWSGIHRPFKTTDGGNTWIEQTHTTLSFTRDVFFINNFSGYITENNRLYSTSNGGLNWFLNPSLTDFGHSRFSNKINNVIYLTGIKTYRIVLPDGIWSEIEELNGSNVNYIRQSQFTQKIDIAVGEVGLIMKHEDTLVLNVSNTEYITAASFNLHQNYPNPFNPITTISFDVPISTNVELKIYNTRGQLVTTLVNDTKRPGTHRVHFNATNLSSGIYLYKIEANGFTETKKMIFLK